MYVKNRFMIFSPQKMKMIAPRERKGPKGIAYFRSFFFTNITVTPTMEPKREPRKSENMAPKGPIKEPIIPRSFTSPKPIPSVFFVSSYANDTAHKVPAPTRRPSKESVMKKFGLLKMERKRPVPRPPRLSRSGTILNSRSIKDMAIRTLISAHSTINSRPERLVNARPVKRKPVRSSTIGYLIGITFLQFLHLPLRMR